jgi:hypothetical protein
MKKVITSTKEYDNEGKLIKETTTTETFEEYPNTIIWNPSYPVYPVYPQQPWITVTY